MLFNLYNFFDLICIPSIQLKNKSNYKITIILPVIRFKSIDSFTVIKNANSNETTIRSQNGKQLNTHCMIFEPDKRI